VIAIPRTNVEQNCAFVREISIITVADPHVVEISAAAQGGPSTVGR